MGATCVCCYPICDNLWNDFRRHLRHGEDEQSLGNYGERSQGREEFLLLSSLSSLAIISERLLIFFMTEVPATGCHKWDNRRHKLYKQHNAEECGQSNNVQ